MDGCRSRSRCSPCPAAGRPGNAAWPRSQYPITCAKIAGWPGVRAATDAFHAIRAV